MTSDAHFAALRQTMVDSQLRTVGVNDETVVAAFHAVSRERFVPPALAGLAYADAALEVATGRFLLEPLVLGLLLQHVELQAGERLLIIGAATGYSAAVAAALGARVTAVESDPALAAMAKAAAGDLPGVSVVEGALADGCPAQAPYDVILFEGAIEAIPDSLAAQLAPGGRAAAVVRQGGVGRACAGPLLAGRIAGMGFLEVAARPLPGFARPKEFAF